MKDFGFGSHPFGFFLIDDLSISMQAVNLYPENVQCTIDTVVGLNKVYPISRKYSSAEKFANFATLGS